MASYIFSDLLQKAAIRGIAPAKEKESREWFRKKAKTTAVQAEALISKNKDKQQEKVSVGSMFTFAYEAKHAKTLPYYDRFPLIFPFKKVQGGFYGLNMHYLPPKLRGQLMDALYTLSSNKLYNESTRLKLNYDAIQAASKLYKPCVKHYLSSQVRSRFMKVDSFEWDIALFLPTQKFVGASNSRVWSDSARRVS